MIHYGDDSSMNFFGRDMGGSRGYSEKTAEAIDAEVLRLVTNAYDRAKELISTHRDAMEKITAALLEYEDAGRQAHPGHHRARSHADSAARTAFPAFQPDAARTASGQSPVRPKEDDGGLLPGLPAPA